MKKYLLIISVFLAACGGEQPSEGQEEKPAVVQTEEEMLHEIEDLKKELYEGDSEYSNATAEKLLRKYAAFAAAYPEHEKAPKANFFVGALAKDLGQYPQSVKYFHRVWNNFPEDPKAPDAMFMEATIYDDNFRQYDKARELYESFQEKYPEHPFAEGVPFLLRTLGMSDEEKMQELEKMGAENSAL